MKHESVIVGALETNCYLVYCGRSLECAVIDPGSEPEKIFHSIAELRLKPRMIINTHGHVDHVGANAEIKEHFGIPLMIHMLDLPLLESVQDSELGILFGVGASPKPDSFLTDGQILHFGSVSLKILHTPGHSPGGISLYGSGNLFSGDTLFCEGVGRTDLPGGSQTDLENSILTKIRPLPPETLVLPGHGPLTTVGREIESNPFLT